MNCDNEKTYDFCTVFSDTVFSKDYVIAEATSEWEIEFTVFDKFGIEVEVRNVTNGKLERINDTTWRVKEKKETLKPNKYTYVMCYLVGDIERRVLKGNIFVNPHK